MTLIVPRARFRAVTGDPVTGCPALPAPYTGADFSLTSSGMATLQMGRVSRELLSSGELITRGINKGKPEQGTPDRYKGVERLEWLEGRLDDYLSRYNPAMVAIEGYAFGAKNGREATGEWGGVARLLLRRRGVEIVTFAPNQVKKFISGNHQAKKPEVVLSLFKRYGVDEPQDDKADASVLSIMALCLANPNAMELTKFQQDALSKKE